MSKPLKLFRVYYEETLEYEDYVEATSEEQAMVIFQHTLESEDGNGMEPLDVTVVEFEAEEIDDDVHTKLVTGLV